MIDVVLILLAYVGGLGVGYVWGQRNAERADHSDGTMGE